MSDIVIVIKGADGKGRSQMAEVIRTALEAQDFKNVSVLMPSKHDIHSSSVPFREQEILIVEGSEYVEIQLNTIGSTSQGDPAPARAPVATTASAPEALREQPKSETTESVPPSIVTQMPRTDKAVQFENLFTPPAANSTTQVADLGRTELWDPHPWLSRWQPRIKRLLRVWFNRFKPSSKDFKV